MAGEDQEKTEDATPRRRQEAREKGQVAFSTEFVAAIMLIAGAALIIGVGMRFMQAGGELVHTMAANLGALGTSDLEVQDFAALMRSSVQHVVPVLVLIVIPMLTIGIVIGYGQIGFGISPKALEIDPNRVNPIKGFGRLFSMRSVVRTGLAIGKITLILTVISVIAWRQVPNVAALEGVGLRPALKGMFTVYVQCGTGALFVTLVLALLDLLYQRFQHEKELRMSKQEVRDEHKTVEGDPHVRARIRQVQREMASRRMMAEVPTATVVVTNPTHFAVALRYEQEGEEREAPRVVAKGQDHLALRIKAMARQHDVVCYEDVPLARALFAQVEVGDEVPEDLYEAVAAVLAYVYRLEGRGAMAGSSR